jgi:hypothetical protein
MAMKTHIEFLTNQTTGKQQVLDLIRQIGEEGTNEPDRFKRQMYDLIIRGLAFLDRHGLQESFKTYYKTHLEDGRPYTIMLVKELKGHVPILEFRVNVKEVGAFRALFFEHIIDDVQILAFVNAIVKDSKDDPLFELIAYEAESILRDFISRPEQYINLVGE